jgi:hypothetical protein
MSATSAVAGPSNRKDEDQANRILKNVSAFCCFGLTVIEAFSGEVFDLEAVQQVAAQSSEGSYEELAIARAELAIFPENSRALLTKFRASLALQDTK